jgi:hypothetical protein
VPFEVDVRAANARERVLAALLARDGTRASERRALHPEPVELARGATGEPLGALFWRELEERERLASAPVQRALTTAPCTPATYYLRRRELERWLRWMRLLEPLAPRWRALFALRSSVAREVCVAVGTHAFACVAAEREPKSLARWLQPLGSRLALGVLDRSACPIERAPAAWVATVGCRLDELVHERSGDSILSALGRVVIAARLADSMSLAALARAGAGRSDLAQYLAAEPLAASADPLELVDRWVDAALALQCIGGAHGND